MLQDNDVSSWRNWFPDLLHKAFEPPVAEQAPASRRECSTMNELALAYSRAAKSNRAAIIQSALKLTDGQVQKVAAGLGVSRSTVWRLGKVT